MTSKIIGIDGNEANLQVRVGVGQYAFNILRELYRLDRKNKYFVYLKSAPQPDLPPEHDNWHYRVFGPSKLWTRLALPLHLFLDGRQLDLFYSPGHYLPVISPFPTMPTIHDLGYLDTPNQFTAHDYHQLVSWTRQSLRSASRISAVSEFTKNELNRNYGADLKKITVVPNGVTPVKAVQPDIGRTLKKFSLTQPYFLYLGTLKPNKNIPFLITAFSRYLKTKPPVNKLVISGKKGWLFDDIFETVKKEGIIERVIFTDYVSETEKWALLSRAQATVLPSLYEGFGIPAIESQAAGTPVIASSIPAFTEVLGKSAIFIDPDDQNSLVAAFKQVNEPNIRQNLISLGSKNFPKYSWENAAKSLIKVFNTL